MPATRCMWQLLAVLLQQKVAIDEAGKLNGCTVEFEFHIVFTHHKILSIF
jgi:hypothetical protein